MELKGPCRILRIYLDESHQWEHQTLYHALVERFLKEEMAGATVLRALEGYGSKARIHSARWIDAAQSLPVVVEVVDRPEKIKEAMKWVAPMLPAHCLVTTQETHVLHYYAPDGKHEAEA